MTTVSDLFEAERVAIWTAIAEIAEFAARQPGAPALSNAAARYARWKLSFREYGADHSSVEAKPEPPLRVGRVFRSIEEWHADPYVDLDHGER